MKSIFYAPLCVAMWRLVRTKLRAPYFSGAPSRKAWRGAKVPHGGMAQISIRGLLKTKKSEADKSEKAELPIGNQDLRMQPGEGIQSFAEVSIKLFFVISLFIFSSCNSNNKEEENNSSAHDTMATALSDTGSSARDFFYSLPSPLVMVKIFRKTGLKYVEGITNSPDNVSKYSSVHSKTLNLGIYSTDLAYTVLNKQTQQASKYMEAIKRLSDELGMSSLFDADSYLKRFKNNLNNEDSLIYIVSQLKKEMDMFMNDNNKEKQTLLIFIGSWVENMYIATQLTKESNKDKVAIRIAEQKHILNNLMNVGAEFQSDNEFKNLYIKLSDIKNLLDKLTVQGADEKITMDELQLKAITEKTYTLRKEIIE